MSAGTQQATGAGNGGKYLTFAISSERYGVEILKVQEIIGITQITHVPRCPDFIKGVINLRGKIIPLVDLRLKFGIAPIEYDSKTCVIVVNIQRGDQRIAAGVIVDTVLEVIDFASAEIEPAPDYGVQVDSSFIIGLGKRDNALSILVDIEKVLTQGETANLAEMTVD